MCQSSSPSGCVACCPPETAIPLNRNSGISKSKLKEACGTHVRDKRDLVSIDDGALLLDSDRLGRIKELVESGAFVPVNDRTYPFEQMVEAHEYVELGHKMGNVAVTVNRVAP